MPTSCGFPLVQKETIEFDNWPLELGPHLTSVEARKVRAFICSYRRCFAFSLHDLESYEGKSIHIQLEDDHLIFRRPYNSIFPRGLASKLIKLSNGEYACATVMALKNDIFGN